MLCEHKSRKHVEIIQYSQRRQRQRDDAPEWGGIPAVPPKKLTKRQQRQLTAWARRILEQIISWEGTRATCLCCRCVVPVTYFSNVPNRDGAGTKCWDAVFQEFWASYAELDPIYKPAHLWDRIIAAIDTYESVNGKPHRWGDKPVRSAPPPPPPPIDVEESAFEAQRQAIAREMGSHDITRERIKALTGKSFKGNPAALWQFRNQVEYAISRYADATGKPFGSL